MIPSVPPPSSSVSSTPRDGFVNPIVNQRLMEAVRANRPDDVRAALDNGANPNTRDQHKALLHWAAYHGYEEVLGLLLDAGATAQTLNQRGETPLHEVAASSSYGNDEDGQARAQRIMQRLLDAGADPRHVGSPDPVNRRGQGTAAHALAGTMAGALALREILRAAPDLVHATDQRGDTPLAVAVIERRHPAVIALLEAGANPLITNLSGESPMSLAQRIQPALVECFNVELVNRERAALVPLINPEVASMTPSRLKTRL